MKDALDKVCSMVNRIYGGAALLLLAVLTGAMAVQVFTRYVLGSSCRERKSWDDIVLYG